MRAKLLGLGLAIGLLLAQASPALALAISLSSQTCLDCHQEATPGIVADWEKSLHARVTPQEALKKPALGRLVSTENIPAELATAVVGCAECHTAQPRSHADSFEHNGFAVHTVVTPADCALCHATEAAEYRKNLMSQAHGNLTGNSLYLDLARQSVGPAALGDGKLSFSPPDAETMADACLFCHGTKVEAKGLQRRETDFGAMDFPVLSGWPNRGVGRLNPDGSKGACSACHTRHQFSIEMARKPYTCAECHKGPDVPAYAVYQVSKHGAVYSALNKSWNFTAVPWKVGQDFTAPTCAACHVSLLANAQGQVTAKRTHQMSDRLPLRLLGLIYAHPHPVSPDTSAIRNKAGLPLPTELTGQPVQGFLIDEKTMAERKARLQAVCLNCHGLSWVQGHFARLDKSVETTNAQVLAATKLLTEAWKEGLAKGLDQGDSPFNEAIEKKWIELWFFHANSTRFATAMAGADHGVFEGGRFQMNRNLTQMHDWLKSRRNK